MGTPIEAQYGDSSPVVSGMLTVVAPAWITASNRRYRNFGSDLQSAPHEIHKPLIPCVTVQHRPLHPSLPREGAFAANEALLTAKLGPVPAKVSPYPPIKTLHKVSRKAVPKG